MQYRENMQQRLIQLALYIAAVSTALAPTFNGLTPAATAAPVTAKSANAFVNSMCVNTHWGFSDTPYGYNYNQVKQRLVDLGIRHVRDGGSSASVIAKMKDLASIGIKTQYIMNPNDGVAPNSSYGVTSPFYYINDFVKNKVGTNVIDAVEILSEIDVFYNLNGGYYWRPGDTEKINSDPNSELYWVKYARSVTKDTWNALKNDPETAGVTVVGPSLGVTYDYNRPSPLGDLSSYVDWGNFHPYASSGNPFNFPFSYNTLNRYYQDGNFPTVNIDEYPFAFDIYRPPFGSKPMAATETGYHTGMAFRSVSEKVHGKYMPRIFLEYFRLGIVRTCSYEFVDSWNNPSYSDANYGLLRHDLSPKPAYTALKNIIGLLKDPGNSFTPGALNYTLRVTPPAGYNRTQYVHHLLLQKRDRSFYLVLWHEISNNDITTTPNREITPPAMPTKVILTTPIRSATVYSLDDLGNKSSSAATLANNTLSLNVTDKAMVVKLTRR